MDASSSHAHPAASASLTLRETIDETLPLIGANALYGPPVVLMAVPGLLLAMILAGPFALVFTVVVLLVVAAGLLGLIGALLAAPYLLVRRLHGRAARPAPTRAPAAPLVPGGAR